MAKIIRLGAVLFLITAVTGIILGGVHTVTLEPIRLTKERQKLQAFSETLPGAEEFEHLKVKDSSGLITDVSLGSKEGKEIGHNVTVVPRGYSNTIELVVGIDRDGVLRGVKILTHSETPGLGAKADDPEFLKRFRDINAEQIRVVKGAPQINGDVEAISGATITSEAIAKGVNAALVYCLENFGTEREAIR